jgi:hypothetical protein
VADRQPWIPAPPPPEIDIPEGVRAGETRSPERASSLQALLDEQVLLARRLDQAEKARLDVLASLISRPHPDVTIDTERSESGHQCTFELRSVSYSPTQWKTAVLYGCASCTSVYSDVLDGHWTMSDVEKTKPEPFRSPTYGVLADEWLAQGALIHTGGGRSGIRSGRVTNVALHPTDRGKSLCDVTPEDAEPFQAEAHRLMAVFEVPFEDLIDHFTGRSDAPTVR